MLAVAALAASSYAHTAPLTDGVHRPRASARHQSCAIKSIAPEDDRADIMHTDSWSSARSVAGQPIYSRPSTVDAKTLVEVHQHPMSWRSLVFIDDRVGVQSVVKVDDTTGLAEPTAIASEYLKTMAAVALSARGDVPTRRILMLGMGAGSMCSLLSHCCPEAVQIDAVELDGAVAEAACGPLGLDTSRINVHVDDALVWLNRRAEQQRRVAVEDEQRTRDGTGCKDERYDLICIDIFDGLNRTPEAFYSKPFLADLRACLSAQGVVVHNLHSGGADLDRRLEDACAMYAEAFPNAACRVPSLRRGNTVVGVAAFDGAFSSLDALQASAQSERHRRGLLFDASARLSRPAPLSWAVAEH